MIEKLLKTKTKLEEQHLRLASARADQLQAQLGIPDSKQRFLPRLSSMRAEEIQELEKLIKITTKECEATKEELEMDQTDEEKKMDELLNDRENRIQRFNDTFKLIFPLRILTNSSSFKNEKDQDKWVETVRNEDGTIKNVKEINWATEDGDDDSVWVLFQPNKME